MIKLKIENFGPIIKGFTSDNGWMEIRKNTFLIGNQGSGKSTVAKLFSSLTWLEKSINRGDTKINNFTPDNFIEITRFQKINNYFKAKTYIDYMGEKYRITFNAHKKTIKISVNNKSHYVVPKIMYVPAERNFLSTISDAYSVKGLTDNLFTFAEELIKAQKALKGKKLDLQIGTYKYEYSEDEDSSFVSGDNYKINLLEASSGLQSYTPLYLVSRNLSNSISEKKTIRNNLSVTQSIRLDEEIAKIMRNNSMSEGNCFLISAGVTSYIPAPAT